MWKIAFRNLLSKKTRTMLALVGLMIAVIGVVGLISISDGIKNMINDTIGSMQGVQVMQKDALSPVMSTVKVDLIKDIEGIPEVNMVTPRVFGIAYSVDGESTLSGMTSDPPVIIGLDPALEIAADAGGLFDTKPKQGRFLKSSDKYSTVIGAEFADKFDKSVGSVVKLNNVKFKVVGIWDTGSTTVDINLVVPISIAREMFGVASNEANMLYVDLKDASQAELVSKKIELRIDGIDAKTGSEYAADISSVIGSLDMFFWAISSIAILVGGVGILNTMLMSVMERFRDLGILKAIGWANADVMRLIISESIILGTVGGLMGVTVGYVLVEIARPILGFPMQVSFTLGLTAFALAVSLGLIGGIYPAFKASRLNPIEAIRYG